MFGSCQLRMKAFLICVFVLLGGCSSNQPKDAESNAQKAAEIWLSALDNGDEDFLWQHISQITKNKEEKAGLLKGWTGGRINYGGLVKRELQLNFEMERYKLRGDIPDGIYRRIVYWTKYEKYNLAKEEIFLSFEGGEWKVLQYRVL